MHGLHVTSDLWGCNCDASLLTDAELLRRLARAAVANAALSYVADRFYTFPSIDGQAGGVTGTVLLAESHLALHTWPERRSVALDVYVCNFCDDNSGKAESLLQELVAHFQPSRQASNRLIRGDIQAG